MWHKKTTRAMTFIVIVGLIFLFIFSCAAINKPLENSQSNASQTMLVSALESYYGEWEIVEDFGYHGIHRTIEIEKFEVGKVLHFNSDVFKYADSINVSYPRIVIEMTTSPEIQAIDGMMDPGAMGFTVNDIKQYYAKIYIKESGKVMGKNIAVFYIINDKEIILEGDIHRYYRAVKIDAN